MAKASAVTAANKVHHRNNGDQGSPTDEQNTKMDLVETNIKVQAKKERRHWKGGRKIKEEVNVKNAEKARDKISAKKIVDLMIRAESVDPPEVSKPSCHLLKRQNAIKEDTLKSPLKRMERCHILLMLQQKDSTKSLGTLSKVSEGPFKVK